MRESGLADLFGRIEIVSEKDEATYRRLLAEFGLRAGEFAMVGNSLRSDVAPVVALGGWGVHMPYHVTWTHETVAETVPDASHLRTVAVPGQLPAAIAALHDAAASAARG